MMKMVHTMHIQTDPLPPFLCSSTIAGASKYAGTAPKITIMGVAEQRMAKIKISKVFTMFSSLLLFVLFVVQFVGQVFPVEF